MGNKDISRFRKIHQLVLAQGISTFSHHSSAKACKNFLINNLRVFRKNTPACWTQNIFKTWDLVILLIISSNFNRNKVQISLLDINSLVFWEFPFDFTFCLTLSWLIIYWIGLKIHLVYSLFILKDAEKQRSWFGLWIGKIQERIRKWQWRWRGICRRKNCRQAFC